MLNADTLADAMGNIRDEYIQAAGCFLRYQEEMPMKHTRKYSKSIRFIALAAALVCLLAVTALAAGLFDWHSRIAPPGEKFVAHYSEARSGYVEWDNASLVLELDGPEECNKIQIRPGWMPFELTEDWKSFNGPDGWYDEMYIWRGCGIPANLGGDMADLEIPCQVQVYYGAQFANGGAAILNDYEPGPITEKTINGHKALVFEAKLELPANEEYGIAARTLHMNYVILLSEDEGYMLVIGGHAGLDVLEKIAENLEVRKTDEIITGADFESSNVFFNVTQG